MRPTSNAEMSIPHAALYVQAGIFCSYFGIIGISFYLRIYLSSSMLKKKKCKKKKTYYRNLEEKTD